MGYFIRVQRGQLDHAWRQIQKWMSIDKKAIDKPAVHVKKSAKRRKARDMYYFKKERNELMENLRIIFERRARGF